jgi:type IV secretory pathway VirB3-like protein
MLDTRQYAKPVHRSLLQREMLGGIPQIGLIALIMLAVIFVYGFGMGFMLIPIVLLYFVLRILTNRDQFLIDIVLENIQQKDVYIP